MHKGGSEGKSGGAIMTTNDNKQGGKFEVVFTRHSRGLWLDGLPNCWLNACLFILLNVALGCEGMP